MTQFSTRQAAVASLILAAWLFGLPDSADAQRTSLWQQRDPSMVNMIADVKARGAGDLLYVTIDEQSDVENKDQRTMRKQNSSTSEGTGSYGAGGGLGTAAGNLSFDQETAANRLFNGNTQFKSERGFSDRFAVQVIDQLPNGNLVISGKRNMALEGDNRTLVLSGVIRSADVLPDNTISSRMVSGLNIRYESSQVGGPESRFLNQGWLGKKLNRLWPH